MGGTKRWRNTRWNQLWWAKMSEKMNWSSGRDIWHGNRACSVINWLGILESFHRNFLIMVDRLQRRFREMVFLSRLFELHCFCGKFQENSAPVLANCSAWNSESQSPGTRTKNSRKVSGIFSKQWGRNTDDRNWYSQMTTADGSSLGAGGLSFTVYKKPPLIARFACKRFFVNFEKSNSIPGRCHDVFQI